MSGATMTDPSKIVALVLTILSGVIVVNADFICLSDADCAKPNTYCYQTGSCANCTDCHIWHRNSGKGCAKNKDQCGDCFAGMVAETNIDGTLSVCRPVVSPTTKLPIKDDPIEDTNINDIFWYILSLCIIATVVILLCCYYTKSNCPRYQNQIVNACRSMRLCLLMTDRDREGDLEYASKNRLPSAPSFVDSSRPPNPPLYSEICPPVENDANQTATPFVNPCYATNCSYPIYSEDPEDEEPEHVNLIPEPISENEETIPSSWTPGPNSSNVVDSSSARLTFENSISTLRNLDISQPDGTVAVLQNQQSSSSNSGATSSNSIPRNNTNNNTGNNTNNPTTEPQNYAQNVVQTQINININSPNVFQGQFS